MGECLLARHGGMGKTQSKIQLISYVGTGTVGKSGACSITADFEIACAIMLSGSFDGGVVMTRDELTTSYVRYQGFYSSSGAGDQYGKKSADGKTFYWYGANAYEQYNGSGEIYYVLAIGA